MNEPSRKDEQMAAEVAILVKNGASWGSRMSAISVLFASVRAEGVAQGRAEERARIVAWLRTQEKYQYVFETVNCIESGEHVRHPTDEVRVAAVAYGKASFVTGCATCGAVFSGSEHRCGEHEPVGEK